MLDSVHEQIMSVLTEFNDALAVQDSDRVASCFETDGYWRDLLAYSWNIATMQGHDEIAAMLAAQLSSVAPSGLEIDPDQASEDDGTTISA